MSFRRERDPLFDWRKKNAHKLVEFGIPDEVVNDHHRFILAVQNGDDLDTGWNWSWPDADAGPKLLSLLLDHFDPLGWDLVGHLQRIHGTPRLRQYDKVRLKEKRGRFDAGLIGTIIEELSPNDFTVEFTQAYSVEDLGLLDIKRDWCELLRRSR